jgi:c-di-GMP-related signal transduction protein
MRFLARQPIFDVERNVQAYELLFRESSENCFTSQDPDLASQKAFDTAVLMGLDVLSDGYSIFLNCPHDFIVHGYPTLFDPDFTVIEVLETVEPDHAVLGALRELKRAGYRIALDDYVDRPKFAELVALADIIKVDFLATPPAQRTELVKRYSTGHRQLLAEKVESQEEFLAAADMGFSLFQGYFLCKPDMLATRKVPVLPDSHLRIQNALASSRLDLISIEQLIKSEPALCYRLLRYLKSPTFYLQTEVESILHVLTLLGEVELRKWLKLMSSVIAASGEPNPQLIAEALTRARFAELLAPFTSLSSSALFLTSLFSKMEAVVDRPLPVVLDEVVLPENVHSALMGDTSRLRQCHLLVVAYESADWAQCDSLRRYFRIPEAELHATYREAHHWAGRVTNFDFPVGEQPLIWTSEALRPSQLIASAPKPK